MRPHHICRCVQPHTPGNQSINQSNQTSRSKQAKNPWPKISLTGGGEDDRGALLLGRLRGAIVVVGRWGAGDVDEEEVDQVRDGEEAHGLPLLPWLVRVAGARLDNKNNER